MIRAQLQQSRYDERTGVFDWEPLAELIVQDDGAHRGEHTERFGLRKSLLDPEAGEQVLFADKPGVWVRLLPSAYRTGDVRVVILHDGSRGERTVAPA